MISIPLELYEQIADRSDNVREFVEKCVEFYLEMEIRYKVNTLRKDVKKTKKLLDELEIKIMRNTWC